MSGLLAAGPAVAQEAGPTGRLLTLATTFGLQASDNPDLTEDGRSRVDAFTSFRLGLIDATPSQGLQASVAGALRASRGEDDTSFDLVDPTFGFGYFRESRGSRLTFDASVQRTEVSSLSPLELALDDTLSAQDIEDILNRNTANDDTRLGYALGAALETGRDRPFGIIYSLDVSGTRYSGDVGSLDDRNRATAGIGFRFDLTETLQATAGVGYTIHDGDLEDGVGVDFGLTQRFATASLGGRLGFATDDSGLRTTVALTGSLDRKTGGLTGEIGVTRLDNGDLQLIGAAGASFAFPTAALSFDLSQRVAQVEDDNGEAVVRTVTSLSAAYTRQLTRAWQMGADARYVRASAEDGGESDSYGEAGLSLSRAITRDWSLSLGVSHSFETADDGIDASGNSLSVGLTRSIRLPF